MESMVNVDGTLPETASIYEVPNSLLIENGEHEIVSSSALEQTIIEEEIGGNVNASTDIMGSRGVTFVDGSESAGNDGLQLILATPVEPELVVVGVPTEGEHTTWFREKTMRNFVVANMIMMSVTILAMAFAILTRSNDNGPDRISLSNENQTVFVPSTPSSSPTVFEKKNGVFLSDKDFIMKLEPYALITDTDLLMKKGTPQNNALVWLTRQDSFDPKQLSEEMKISRYVASVIYFSLVGSRWNSSDKWLSGEHLCKWEHISCVNDYVSEIKLVGQGLAGKIPDEITFLPTLKSFNLTSNDIRGTIPYSIGRLSELEILDLSNNKISSSIPKSVMFLTSLEFLRLNGNMLTGTISDSFSNMKNLREISLHRNDIHGFIPSSLAELSDLDVLNVGHTELSGIIPNEICRTMEENPLFLVVDCNKVVCECCPFC